MTRLIWVYQFSEVSQFKFNNQFMINTNDGYFYAEGARDIVNAKILNPKAESYFDKFHNPNDLSPTKEALSQLTAFLVKFLPFSFETVIFYMPAFLASLIVIPLILIGRSFGRMDLGFIAALLASIAWSYYNRTMVGYYDTDMLNIVFPTLLLWSLVWAVRTKEDKYLLITALDMIAYRWWYPQSYSLEFAIIFLLIIFVIYQYIKKENYQYNLVLIIFILFAMMNLNGYIRFSTVIFLYILLKYKRDIILQNIFYILAIGILAFFISGGFSPIWGQLKSYVFRDSVDTIGSNLSLHFYNVMQTVREANAISFKTFANRISGHIIIFLLSVLGYIWLVFRYPVMLFGLPMIGLGFLAYKSGLRFTIYAVPILAFGIAFLIVQIADFIKNRYVKYAFLVLATFTILFPNILHIINYKVPTVFTKDEVKVLDKLKHIAKREDYVVAWWDYGYPIRYYSDVKTLVDGGKHSGKVNFPVSFILTHPQDVAAKMARLDVEYTEKRFKVNKHNKNLDKNDSNYIKWQPSNIAQMTLDYGFKSVNDFLNSLNNKNFKLPQKTREIYIYLPNRMMNIYPTITLFSNLDLETGVKKPPHLFYKTNFYKENQFVIDLGNGVGIDKRTNTLIIRNNRYPINKFAKVYYDKNGKLKKDIITINRFGNLNVIFMPNYKQFIVLDNTLYNSLFIQLFVFENYDKKLFEPVIITPLVKVYKLKI